MTAPDSLTDPESLRTRALDALTTARERTALLTSCVEDPELTAQHSPLMSPLVWDLAHIGNQEELWLLREVAGREAMRPEIDGLYDAFEHPRAARPSLPLLPPAEARQYAAEVRGRALDVLESAAFQGTRLTEAGFAFGMIAQHEQQHDETMLITHQLRKGPAALTAPDPAPAPLFTGPAEVLVPEGPFVMGTSTEPWALDNERPAHRRTVPAFFIDTTPVTNAAYQAFIEDGGYGDRRWWTPRAGTTSGRTTSRRRCSGVARAGSGCGAASSHRGRTARRAGAARLLVRGRRVRALGGAAAAHRGRVGEGGPPRPGGRPLHPLSVGRRRPHPGTRQPRPAPSASGPGRQLFGGRIAAGRTAVDRRRVGVDVERSAALPRLRGLPYREYSEVFFGPEYKVLRGGSFAVDPVACRGTFRNWDYPIRRQIFSGFRTARDAAPGSS